MYALLTTKYLRAMYAMDKESMRLLLKTVLQENPEILNEIVNERDGRDGEIEKLEKPQTVRLTTKLRERIEKLCPDKRGQAKIIRQALNIGLTQLEKS